MMVELFQTESWIQVGFVVNVKLYRTSQDKTRQDKTKHSLRYFFSLAFAKTPDSDVQHLYPWGMTIPILSVPELKHPQAEPTPWPPTSEISLNAS
jgi:hypothetical protein